MEPLAALDHVAPQLICVVGATGTGKSGHSLDVAELLHAHGHTAEVVNADAMQLYRGMDIGTAKLSVHERRGITHHLLDVLDVDEEASVARYQIEARAVIDDVLARGSWPVLVGGSGLYVSSVLYNFDFPGSDPVIRARLEAELALGGPGLLFDKLHSVDPDAAARIGSRNGRRIVRALEVAEITGSAVSGSLPTEPRYWRPASVTMLTVERQILVERLDSRVDQMWADGLLGEVAALTERGLDDGVTARRAIGYAQALSQLSGDLDEEDARAQTRLLTRKYARRQVSWFKRYADLLTIDASASTSGLAERTLAHVLRDQR